MTCACRAQSCYVCKARLPNTGWQKHFKPHGPCPLFADSKQVNAKRVLEAAKTAVKQLGKETGGLAVDRNFNVVRKPAKAPHRDGRRGAAPAGKRRRLAHGD